MKNILEKKAKKFIKLSTDREIKKYAYKWVLFQYQIEELNDFIEEIRKEKVLQEDMESASGLFSGAKGNNSLELENDLRDYFLKEYM